MRRLGAAMVWAAVVLSLGTALESSPAWGQGSTAATESASSSCTLKDHVYHCDGAAFQKTLEAAKTASIETHSVDKLAQAQLAALITKKLGKTLVADGAPTDLIFLLIPTGVEGMSVSSGAVDLGTLRVYAATPSGGRANLVWAENYAGPEDLPWPAVVSQLIGQFKGHFKIK